MQTDLSKEQAVRWVAREMSRLDAYDEIYDRILAERIVLDKAGDKAERYPMTTTARRQLLKRLEAKLDRLRLRLH